MKQNLSQNTSFSNFDLSFEDCLKILDLEPNYTIEQLSQKFTILSKEFHPDRNSDSLLQYLKISKSYDKLKKALSISSLNDNPLKIEKPKIERCTNPLENILQYTILLNWMDIFVAWSSNGKYEKNIRYGYNKTCTCEELCGSCKGSGISMSTYCNTCMGKGWKHYCDECQGKGLYLKKDDYNLELPYGIPIPKEIIITQKGNEIGFNNRGPLLLNVKFTDTTKQIKNGIFVYLIYLKPEMLNQPYIEIFLTRDKSIFINTKEIEFIPYKKDLNLNFNIIYNRIKIKIYLYFRLKLF